jgi:mannosyl-oligosaccharide alpha-1,2-mannosidase
LSAYALSGEDILLQKADRLGTMLVPAFNTSGGMPTYAVNTLTGQHRDRYFSHAVLAEAMSCQMEYKYLAHLTSNETYFRKVDLLMDYMVAANVTGGRLPTNWSPNGEPRGTTFSVGAYSDSAHEYFLKQWLMSGKTETKALELCTHLSLTHLVISTDRF